MPGVRRARGQGGAGRHRLYPRTPGQQPARRRSRNRRHPTIAGTTGRGYSGDGGPAVAAVFDAPKEMALDRDGSLLIVDTENHAIRHIDRASGIVTTIAGGRTGGTATAVPPKRPGSTARTAPWSAPPVRYMTAPSISATPTTTASASSCAGSERADRAISDFSARAGGTLRRHRPDAGAALAEPGRARRPARGGHPSRARAC